LAKLFNGRVKVIIVYQMLDAMARTGNYLGEKEINAFEAYGYR
jgi:hypothetical protein